MYTTYPHIHLYYTETVYWSGSMYVRECALMCQVCVCVYVPHTHLKHIPHIHISPAKMPVCRALCMHVSVH